VRLKALGGSSHGGDSSFPRSLRHSFKIKRRDRTGAKSRSGKKNRRNRRLDREEEHKKSGKRVFVWTHRNVNPRKSHAGNAAHADDAAGCGHRFQEAGESGAGQEDETHVFCRVAFCQKHGIPSWKEGVCSPRWNTVTGKGELITGKTARVQEEAWPARSDIRGRVVITWKKKNQCNRKGEERKPGLTRTKTHPGGQPAECSAATGWQDPCRRSGSRGSEPRV